MEANGGIEAIMTAYVYAQYSDCDELSDDIRRHLGHLKPADGVAIPTAAEYRSYLIDPPISLDQLPDCLRSATVHLLEQLAASVLVQLVESDPRDDRTSRILQDFCNLLWPLYSRHSRTNEIGFEMQEYADFFPELGRDERKQLAVQLADDWGVPRTAFSRYSL